MNRLRLLVILQFLLLLTLSTAVAEGLRGNYDSKPIATCGRNGKCPYKMKCVPDQEFPGGVCVFPKDNASRNCVIGFDCEWNEICLRPVGYPIGVCVSKLADNTCKTSSQCKSNEQCRHVDNFPIGVCFPKFACDNCPPGRFMCVPSPSNPYNGVCVRVTKLSSRYYNCNILPCPLPDRVW